MCGILALKRGWYLKIGQLSIIVLIESLQAITSLRVLYEDVKFTITTTAFCPACVLYSVL